MTAPEPPPIFIYAILPTGGGPGWGSELPLYLYLHIRLTAPVYLLQTAGDMVAVEIIGGARLHYSH